VTQTPTRPARAAGQRPESHRTLGDVLRGVLAALVLTGLVAGLPVLLVVLSPSGFLTGAPTWDDVVGLLTRPDDGHLFLDALALLGWIAWASFAVSVVTEVVSAARGLPAPHLPMLGLTQAAAAALITTATVLVTTTTTGPTPPARASTVSTAVAAASLAHPVAGNDDEQPRTAARSSRPEHQADISPRHLPTVTVRRGDTLWRLASTHLGDGARWREIFDLNAGAAQTDGGQLTEARWIFPGWNLRLPADATGVPKRVADDRDRPATDPRPQPPPVYVVQPGDTLWDIAAERLGDGARYREIYDHNKSQVQPDGQALRDPDRIHPGWHLVLPVSNHPTTATHASHPVERARATPPTENPSRDPVSADSTTPPAPRASPPTPDNQRDETTITGRNTAPTTNAHDGWDSAAAEVGLLIAGLTALGAAGAIGEIARRRRRQQALRRPGQRVPMPEPDTADAQLEQALRVAPQPITLTALKQALRTLATNCARQQRALPRLAAVLVSMDRVELLLAEKDLEPLAPFTTITDHIWAAPLAALLEDAKAELADDDVPDPYPALVSLGVSDDAVLLINLEAAGTLTIAGEHEQSVAVLRALVCELATSELSAGCSVTLGAEFTELAEVCDRTHVNVIHSSTRLSARITAHGQALRAVLDSASVTDVHEARSRDVAEDAWTPEIVASATPVGAPAVWSGVTAVTCSESPRPGWTLQLRPGDSARLEPLAIDVQPSSLDMGTYNNLTSLLRRGHEHPTHPALTDGTQEGTTPRPVDGPPGDDEAAAILANLPTAPHNPLRTDHADARPITVPRMLFLGQLGVRGADNSMGAARRGRATELVAYLVLHPGASAHQIDEVMWPGQRVTRQNRNAFVSRVRHWLGETPDAEPYLAHVNDGGDYRIHPDVTCDWHDFLQLARAGLGRGEDGTEDLEGALKLVRGRPFLGIDPATYTWAEADTQQMISAIVDVAHTLANMRLKQGDARAAQGAAAVGLLAEPASEVLYRDAMRAALLRGDTPEVRRLRSQLLINLASIDPDAGLEAETIELLAQRSQLLP
jgi:nucleoid-associated protein YgaU/DNA-binding SARP family transcriptional activator